MHSADTLRGIKDTIDDHLDGGRRKASYGLGNQDAAPPGGAYWQPGGGSWADGVFSGSGPDPKFWRGTSEDLIDRGDEDIDEVDVTEGTGETNHWDESDRPAQGKNARRRQAAENMPQGNHDLDVANIDQQINPYTGDGGSGSQLDLALDGFGTVNWKGGARRYAEDLHEEPDFFAEDGGRKPKVSEHRYEPDMEREGRRFYADEEEVRNDLIQSVGEEIEGIGLYNDFLDDAEDVGNDDAADAIEETIRDEYDHLDRFSDALEREGGMNDVVRRFQASGGGALATSGGGNFGDDAIAGQARKFLAKTAGRVYSLAEQQELVDETHPQGARNKPNEDDLKGTHYV
jgi:hypothetical protein